MITEMKNVYDIRYEKKLVYILPRQTAHTVREAPLEAVRQKTAVILYLYYLERLSVYLPYLDGIPQEIDVYIVSSREEVLEAVRKYAGQSGRKRIQYILKENRGRDISALLVAADEIIKKYEYICFLHDKKEHSEELRKDTELWVENLWGNLLGGSGHIDRILELFAEYPELGVLAPPEPIGDHFCTWYGYGWHKSFGITKELADHLQLNADLTVDKPPLTIGTALWFRREALKKLFSRGWEYSDFDDDRLNRQDYVSYGIERIFPYAAQDAGFETGTVMTAAYAEKQTAYLQYSTSALLAEAKSYFPVPCISDLRQYEKGKEGLLCFARQNQKVYLYGAGVMGRFCFYLLREANLCAEGYFVSRRGGDHLVCGLPVYCIQDEKDLSGSAVIVTALEERVREEMIQALEDRGCDTYFVFWG